MKIIEVIPIARGIGKETLSYFTSEAIQPGSIVSVPLRSKIISGLVVRTEDVVDMKASIKSAPFMIRKAEKIDFHQFLTPEFISSVQDTARFHAATMGSVLNVLLPKVVLENSSKAFVPPQTAKITSVHEKFVLQAGFEDRVSQYKGLIRECFAKKQSIYVCAPNIADARRIHTELSKGIEKYTVLLHTGLPKKVLFESWEQATKTEHPMLIIGTGRFLCVPRKDISLIILEKENSKGYKTISRPFLDIRTFAEIFAKKNNIKFVCGDTLLRVETLWRHDRGEFLEIISPSYRLRNTSSEEQIIDMKQYSPSQGKEFQMLSDELISSIKDSIKHHEHIAVFTVRRGLSPITLCGDCGTIVYCHKCHAPITLHSQTVGEEKQYFFLCHRCGERRPAEERCAHCDSWKLVMLGVGIQGLEKDLSERFPGTPIFRIDSDTTPTDKKIRTVMKGFTDTPGSILIGTEMMMPYITSVEHTAIVSIDALFSLPDFRINERLMYTILSLRQAAQKSFILQTRAREQKIFEHALKSNILDFYREEIQERESYGYPPFSVLIKISMQGKREVVYREMEKVKIQLQPYNLVLFPAFIKNAEGNFSMHGLIKIPHEKWVDDELLAKLQSLPPYFSVAIDPESLL